MYSFLLVSYSNFVPKIHRFWDIPYHSYYLEFPFSALTQSVGWQKEHLARKKSWVLVCCWWQFDWSFSWLTAPVATTTSTSLASIKLASPVSSGKWQPKWTETKRGIIRKTYNWDQKWQQVRTDLLVPDEVGFKEESSAARLTLVVPVTMVHVPLMQQVALLTRELRRTLRTSENTHTEPVSHFFLDKKR